MMTHPALHTELADEVTNWTCTLPCRQHQTRSIEEQKLSCCCDSWSYCRQCMA